MSTFLLAYRVPKDYVPGSPEVVPAWKAFFEGLRANLVDVGNPVFDRTTLGCCAADTVLGGYSLVTADDLDAAVALAAGCPALTIGGGVEVGELTLLNPDSVTTTVDDHARAAGLAGRAAAGSSATA